MRSHDSQDLGRFEVTTRRIYETLLYCEGESVERIQIITYEGWRVDDVLVLTRAGTNETVWGFTLGFCPVCDD